MPQFTTRLASIPKRIATLVVIIVLLSQASLAAPGTGSTTKVSAIDVSNSFRLAYKDGYGLFGANFLTSVPKISNPPDQQTVARIVIEPSVGGLTIRQGEPVTFVRMHSMPVTYRLAESYLRGLFKT